jgi:hypothetical protein
VAARVGGGALRGGEEAREGEEAGRPGTAPGCGGRRGQERGGARPEVGDGPDRWAPPVGGCEREKREAGVGGPYGPEAGLGRGWKMK